MITCYIVRISYVSAGGNDGEMKEVIITLLTESHGGIVHDVMISLSRGLAPQSDGLTSSLFCLQ